MPASWYSFRSVGFAAINIVLLMILAAPISPSVCAEENINIAATGRKHAPWQYLPHSPQYGRTTNWTSKTSDLAYHTATSCCPQSGCIDGASAGSCTPSCCELAACSPCMPARGNNPCGSGYMCCQPLFPPNRVSVRAEYLLWWSNNSGAPALVSTSSAGTPPATAGVLGEPNTSILFGGSRVNTDAHSGGRFTLNYWFDNCRFTGIETTYLGIGKDTTRFTATSGDWPILARPYYDVTSGTEVAMLVAHPDFLVGSITATSSTEFQSAEVLIRQTLIRCPGNGIDFVLGWRFARLDESLRVAHSSQWTEAQGQIVVGTTKDVLDLFDTKSQFHGAELGVLFKNCHGPWSFDMLMKLGLGNTRSEVFIDGRTVTTVPDAGSATFSGGLLAQETNMGRYRQDDFAVIPEVGITLGYNVTCRLRLTCGYTFIYWNKVARAADQIDCGMSQLPPEPPTGAERPIFAFQISDYWAQGMNFGLEYRF